MDGNEDWLELPKSGPELLIEALGDDTSPAIADFKVPATVDPEYAAVVRAYRQLSPNQRIFCKCLLRTYGRVAPAIRLMRDEMFITVQPSTVSRWRKNPRFVNAVELTKKQCLKLAEIDPSSLMLRAAAVIDNAMEEQPIVSRGGEVVGYEVDRQSALRGIEWLGKVHKMGGDDGTNRTTLHLHVNLATREEIDVTPRPALEDFAESVD